jgi:3-hydroxyacyl-CoA dehydrogenase
MKLVEIVHAPDTAEETVAALESLLPTGRENVDTREGRPGPVRLSWRTASTSRQYVRHRRCWRRGSPAEDINKAMVYGFNWPVGPLAMIEGATKGWQ